MAKQSFIVLIEKDVDGVFIGTVPSLKGCYSYGKTLDELMANLEEAIEAQTNINLEPNVRYLVTIERKEEINYLTGDSSQIEKGLELKEKEYDTRDVGHIDLLGIDRNGDFVRNCKKTKKGKESDKAFADCN